MAAPVRPRLILVCGMPAAGKTTLARGLGVALHLPVLVRDDFKTGLVDTHPEIDWTDFDVRRRVAGRSFDDFGRVIGAVLDTRVAVVAEAAWHWSLARDRLAPLFDRSRTTVVAVALDPAISAARFRARFERGERHPSHQDGMYIAAMEDGSFDWSVYLPPADLPVPVVTVDGSLPPDEVLATAMAAL